LTGEVPDDTSKRKAEAERLAALEAERKRAADELNGIRSDIQTLGAQFDDGLCLPAQHYSRGADGQDKQTERNTPFHYFTPSRRIA
jgi:Skp family chaperone for outer membrane proteins